MHTLNCGEAFAGTSTHSPQGKEIEMVRIKPILLASVLVAFTALTGVLSTGAAAQTLPPMDVYAVKFLCGSFVPPPTTPTDGMPEAPVKPGNYLTAINVHNP